MRLLVCVCGMCIHICKQIQLSVFFAENGGLEAIEKLIYIHTYMYTYGETARMRMWCVYTYI